MSFNYLEIEKALQEIHERIRLQKPDLTVRAAEFVEFPLLRNKATDPAVFADLNLALRFSGAMLVFGLRSPWVGVFWMPPSAFRKLKNTSLAGFSLSQLEPLGGQRLDKIEQVENDRVVKLFFSEGAVLQVDLFGQRPNWKLTAGGLETRWRPDTAGRSRADPGHPGKSPRLFQVRQFERWDSANWLERAYLEYRSLKQAAFLKASQARALGEIEKRLAHLARARGAMQGQLLETRDIERWRHAGESLKALLHRHPPHFKADRLEGFEYPLNSGWTLAQNADHFFERAKKLRRTSKEAGSRLSDIEARIRKQASLVQSLRGMAFAPGERQEGFEAEYAKLEELLLSAGLDARAGPQLDGRGAKQKNKMAEAGARQFRSQEGLLIWVGRTQEENEKIVIKWANGNDVWLHIKGRPGSHAIVQVPRGKSASLETLLDAAHLVAHYSNASEKDKAEVDYTFRKYVKRVSGPKFTVTYSQNKTLVIKVDRERLKRLLAQEF